MHAFVALYRGGVTQPNSPIIFDDAPRPGVSDPTPTLTRHRGPETHRQRRPARRETHHDMPEAADLALRMLLWHGHSNRNGRYTE